jgi:hypothetical protein
MKILTNKSSSLIVTIQKETAKKCGAIRPLISGTKNMNNKHHEYNTPEYVPTNGTTASYAIFWI